MSFDHKHLIDIREYSADDITLLLDTAERLFGAGHMGIKLHPDMQQTNVDDDRLLPLYDLMQGRYPLSLHAGDPRHPWSRPERISRMRLSTSLSSGMSMAMAK